MKSKKVLSNILLIVFALMFFISLFFIIKELSERKHVSEYVTSIQNQYVPEIPSSTVDSSSNTEQTPPSDSSQATDSSTENHQLTHINTANPTIQKLVADYPDVVGWLTVFGAEVSHPFVLTDNNSSYLWADLDGKYIRGGTLFMDYTNSRDLSDKITVIYGHNMRDGTMFGQLLNYLNFDYLLENPDVYISYPDFTAHYTVAACFVTDGADNPVYNNIGTTDSFQDVIDFIYANADVNPDTPLDENSQILVLSTCHRSYETARTLLICVPD